MVKDRSIFSRISRVLIHFILIICGLITILPIIHLAAMSLSSAPAVAANKVGLWPVNFTTESYKIVFREGKIFTAFLVSVKRVLFGTSLNLVMMIITAYPLSFSNKKLKGRNAYMWFLVFPMLFGGGLIPEFILMRDLGLLDSFWSMIFPGLLPIYNVIMMMNFFKGIPEELQEAALIDGAGYVTILTRIMLPVSQASLATMALFSLVGHWNSWFDAMIYINDFSKWPLQTVLRNIINQQSNVEKLIETGRFEEALRYSDKTLSSAQIFIGTVPVLLVYPFLQKYFVTGITVGAVKG